MSIDNVSNKNLPEVSGSGWAEGGPALFPFLAGSLSVLLGFISIASWFEGVPLFFLTANDRASIYLTTAFCFLLTGFAVIFLSSGMKRVGRFLSVIVGSIAVLTLFECATHYRTGVDLLWLDGFSEIAERSQGRMVAATAVEFLLIAITIFILSFGRSFRWSSLFLFGLMIAIVSVGLTALFGRLVPGSPECFSHAVRMTPESAIGMIVLGVGLGALAVRVKSASVPDVRDLWRAIIVYSTVGALVIALVSSLLAVLPLYDRLHRAVDEQLSGLVRSRASAMTHALRRAQIEFRNVTDRPASIEVEADFYRSAVSREYYVRLARKMIEDALKVDNTIRGLVRVDPEGNELFSSGLEIPVAARPVHSPGGDQNDIDYLSTRPLLLNGRYYIVGSLPAYASYNRLIGRDYALIDLSDLFDILRDETGLPAEARLFLVVRGTTAPSLFSIAGSAVNEESASGEIEVAAKLALDRQYGIMAPNLSDRRERLIAYTPIAESSMGIVLTEDSSEVYSRMNSNFTQHLAGVVLMALLGTFGIFLLVRDLVRHAEQLQVSLGRKTEALNVELRERARIEKELRSTRAKADVLVSNAPDGILMIDENGLLTGMNPAAESLFAAGSSQIEGKPLSTLLLSPDENENAANFLERCLARRGPHTVEAQGLTSAGVKFPVELSITTFDMGAEHLCLAFVRDIRGRKKDEEAIRASLREKEALLTEIHHRVKNNLQIISSLLSLQGRKLDDERSKEAIQESQQRVKSIALIHELVYQSGFLSRIDFSIYAKQLVARLMTVSDPSNRIVLEFDGHETFLNLDTAIPSGLILNELVCNTLKHAFPDNRPGKIFLQILEADDAIVHLTVGDNGVGFGPGISYQNSSSLGFKLISSLIKQLDANLDVQSGPTGTTFKITYVNKLHIKGDTHERSTHIGG